MPIKRRQLIELALIPIIFLLVWLGMKWYRMPGVAAGNAAPLFTGQLASGDSLRLVDLRGQWVLLDFWGSWCGPCRAANRNLVKLYRQYHHATFKNAKGFTIVSVGIETKKENWLRAIQQDQLNWPYHISDLNRLRDHVALLYGIKEIPTTVLIDPEGNIRAVNLDFEQLNAMLTKELAP